MLYAAEGDSCDDNSSGSDTDYDEEEKSCLPLLFTLRALEKHVEVHI